MRIILIPALITLALILGCSSPTSDARYENDLYYVAGLLEEGKPIGIENAIKIGKSIEHADTMNLLSMLVKADVKIYDPSHDKFYSLTQAAYEGQAYPLYFDPMTMIDSSRAFKPEEGKAYTLWVDIYTDSGDSLITTIQAETTIPKKLTVEPNSGYSTDSTTQFPTMVYDSIDKKYPIVAHAEILPGEKNIICYYETFCMESWQDAEYVNVFFGHEKPEDKDEYEDPISQQPRKINFFMSFLPDSNGKIIEDAYSSMFVFYGRYRLTLFSIDQNYYNYMYQTEGYRKSGIQNGIGYFGSVSGVQLYTTITK